MLISSGAYKQPDSDVTRHGISCSTYCLHVLVRSLCGVDGMFTPNTYAYHRIEHQWKAPTFGFHETPCRLLAAKAKHCRWHLCGLCRPDVLMAYRTLHCWCIALYIRLLPLCACNTSAYIQVQNDACRTNPFLWWHTSTFALLTPDNIVWVYCVCTSLTAPWWCGTVFCPPPPPSPSLFALSLCKVNAPIVGKLSVSSCRYLHQFYTLYHDNNFECLIDQLKMMSLWHHVLWC